MSFLKGNKLGLGNKYRLGKSPSWKGKKLPWKIWNKGIKTGLIPKTAFKKGQKVIGTPFKKGHIVPKGKYHWSWRGGKRTERRAFMDTKEYKLWRKAVFERDNYQCIWCGQKGGKLNADHIKPFSLFPELRLAIDNGRTLCEDCHKTTKTYGWNIYHSKNSL